MQQCSSPDQASLRTNRKVQLGSYRLWVAIVLQIVVPRLSSGCAKEATNPPVWRSKAVDSTVKASNQVDSRSRARPRTNPLERYDPRSLLVTSYAKQPFLSRFPASMPSSLLLRAHLSIHRPYSSETMWLLLHTDGRLYVHRGHAHPKRAVRASCRVSRQALAMVRNAARHPRFLALAPYYFRGEPNVGCSHDCREAKCTPGNCFRPISSTVELITEIQIRLGAKIKAVLIYNAKGVFDYEAVLRVLDPLKHCKATLRSVRGRRMGFWRSPME